MRDFKGVSAAQDFSLEQIRRGWPGEECLRGVILFGSRAREDVPGVKGDWDIGLIISNDAGVRPRGDYWPANWDVFIWTEARWRRGFALQLELARTARVLHDPLNIIQDKFEFLRDELLPRWGKYLRR